MDGQLDLPKEQNSSPLTSAGKPPQREPLDRQSLGITHVSKRPPSKPPAPPPPKPKLRPKSQPPAKAKCAPPKSSRSQSQPAGSLAEQLEHRRRNLRTCTPVAES